MNEGLPRRVVLEKLVVKELRSSQIHSLIPLMVSKAIGVFAPEKADLFYEKRMERYKLRYHEANLALKQIEEQEGFPGVKTYINLLLGIVGKLPPYLQQTAYYPNAGTDVFWSAVFQNSFFEDINYNSQADDPTMWWSLNDYNTTLLDAFVNTLKTRGLIPAHHSATFSTNDCQTEASAVDLNQAQITLVYKAGHDFSEYAQTAFKNRELAFGAIIIANDNTKSRILDNLLSKHSYEKLYESNPEKVINPWALALYKPRIYIKKYILVT